MARKRRNRNQSAEGFVPNANPEQAQWMHQLRSSNAASRHTPRPRKGTRAQRERQAIRDQDH